MVVVGWMGAGMEAMVDRHAGTKPGVLFACRDLQQHLPSDDTPVSPVVR